MSKLAYNVIINTGDKSVGMNGFITYHKVHSIEKFRLFATGKYPKWKSATVYNHKTKDKIESIKP